jgi:hypothetical protein
MSILDIWKKSALIDVEASGLMQGSFPVEVGWLVDDVFGHMVIDPSKHWDTSKWDSDAETMHGLSLHWLSMKGVHPVRVASRLNLSFKGKKVFSDSPDADLNWLNELHRAANVKREYEVESIGKLLGYLGVKAEKAYDIFDQVQEIMPSRGRALVGVRYLKTVVDCAIREVGGNEV